MRRPGAALTLAAILVAVAGQPAAAAQGSLQAAKAATAIYHSLDAAMAAGYEHAGEPCIESPAGAMGIHAVNLGLAGDLAIDPLRPEILLNLPRSNGQLELVGVEYWEIALANSGTGPIPWFGQSAPAAGWFNPAPTVFGETFDGPMAGHNPSMPWHYDQHVWLWADNPAGIFAAFNPDLACPGA